MKPNQSSGNIRVIKLTLISVLFFTLTALNAQTPTGFAGKWEFDKARSDKGETGDASFKGTIILGIYQDVAIMTFANTFIRPGMKDHIVRPDTFYIDGRIKNEKFGSVPIKKSVKWSADKKILTTSMIMTDVIDGVSQDFLTANTYQLSDEGKTLTVAELHKSKLNGEQTIKKVYIKK
jgi:hypothetical protein